MAEWSSYRPHDFLLFSPRIYWRLFESINETWWPLALLALLMVALLLHRIMWWRWMPLLLALALAWGFVAWAFLLERYAPINWVAPGVALAFAAQALGLAALPWLAGVHTSAAPLQRRLVLALLAAVLLAYPWLATASGRPWQQAELFGLAPDPTALATLAWLAVLRGVDAPRQALLWLLRAVPLVWCGFSAATLAVMGSGQAWVLGLAGAAVLLITLGARLGLSRIPPR